MKENNEPIVNRTFKSLIFAILYRDKKELLDLYNARPENTKIVKCIYLFR